MLAQSDKANLQTLTLRDNVHPGVARRHRVVGGVFALSKEAPPSNHASRCGDHDREGELRKVTAGDGDAVVQTHDDDLCRLARSATAHLNTDQAEMELLVRGAMRIMRARFIRQ